MDGPQSASRYGRVEMTKTPDKKIRVLVVDDSAFMCKVLQEIINSDPQLEVVGQGRDGRDGPTSSPWTLTCRTSMACRRPSRS
jgi:hypothetical protein